MNTFQPEQTAFNIDPAIASANMMALYRPMLRGMTDYGNALCDGCTAAATEWFNFVNRRLHADLALQVKLSQCCAAEDVTQAWSSFMSAAANDYSTEFSRLSEIGSAASQRAMSAMQASGATVPARLWQKN